MRTDVVGLNILRSQKTSYLSCVNTCRLTGLGVSTTVSLNLSLCLLLTPLRCVTWDSGSISANVCVFICTIKHAFNQEHSSLLWQHHFHNTSVHRKCPPFTAELIDGRSSSRSYCFLIDLGHVCTGAFESLRTLNASLYIIIIIIIIIHFTLWSLLVTWLTNRFKIHKCYILPRCIYVFCVYLRTNSDFCRI